MIAAACRDGGIWMGTNKVAEINADKRGLEARNENGDTTRLDVDRNGDVRARDWHDLRGRVRGNRIEWDNGTTWTRRPFVDTAGAKLLTDLLRTAECRPKPARQKIGLVSRLVAV